MPKSKEVRLEPGWLQHLKSEFEDEYMIRLSAFLRKRTGKTVFPPGSKIFSAFDETPFDKVKVVILGQDPYHGYGQAHGLSFSVPRLTTIPPSLKNIFIELQNDLGCELPGHGCLTEWASQGVLLLNSVLTVEQGSPGSHAGAGWERFTDKVMSIIDLELENVVFMLWGRYAKEKGKLLDGSRHLILTAAHPSPFSARNGFFGCRHFSKTNNYLKENDKEEINWALLN
jgi:uracil-DNA glycosylase